MLSQFFSWLIFVCNCQSILDIKSSPLPSPPLLQQASSILRWRHPIIVLDAFRMYEHEWEGRVVNFVPTGNSISHWNYSFISILSLLSYFCGSCNVVYGLLLITLLQSTQKVYHLQYWKVSKVLAQNYPKYRLYSTDVCVIMAEWERFCPQNIWENSSLTHIRVKKMVIYFQFISVPFELIRIYRNTNTSSFVKFLLTPTLRFADGCNCLKNVIMADLDFC